ncbi:MAG: CDP-diacylglycerol--glycerol-3-phosphate 3-phosphatidyltransferase [Deltaproteobacteria bacterium]|nr:CDP-diacylglycerol--glycerol-3-phosphate 3-phosphatidyltransferase [Deltaproteobacteria bacterium]
MSEEQTKEERYIEVKSIPNILSLFRIGMSPVLILMLLSPGKLLSLVSGVVFLLVCLTDWLDGYLARRLQAVTTLGKFLDPLADKLLIMTALIMLIPLDRAPAWMVALIIGREIAITGLRTIALEEKMVIAASVAGKAKTVTQIIAIVPLLIHFQYFGINFHLIGSYVLWVALFLTLYSGAEYFLKFSRHHGMSGSDKESEEGS